MTLGAWPKLELEAPPLPTRIIFAAVIVSAAPVRLLEEPDDLKALSFFFDWLLRVEAMPRERLDGRSPDPEFKIRLLLDFCRVSLRPDF